jgi:probable F420-dependent oxidoreductase
MKVGVSLPQSTLSTLEDLASFTSAVNDLGFDSAWVGDHLLLPSDLRREDYPYVSGMHASAKMFPDRCWSEAIVTLAVASTQLTRAELGFAVLLPALRAPIVTAKQLATLDSLAGGRTIVGVGVGWQREEYAALGVPYDERLPRVLESVRLAHALWGGEPTDFQGTFTTFDNMVMRPPPAQKGGLRVWYGGNSTSVLAKFGGGISGWLPYEPDSALLARGRAVVADCPHAVTVGAVTRMPLSDGSVDAAKQRLDAYRAAGVEHLVVLSSVGRSVGENVARLQRLTDAMAG